jgi:hypothetical protein
VTDQQTAAIIADALREAAKECGIHPKHALNPTCSEKAGIAARNMAIVLAHKRGVSKADLATGFARSWETINSALLGRKKAPRKKATLTN